MPQGGARGLNTLSLLFFPPKSPPGKKHNGGLGSKGAHFPTGHFLVQRAEWRVELQGQIGNIQHKNRLTQPRNLKGTVLLGARPGPEYQEMSCRAELGIQSLGTLLHALSDQGMLFQ